MQPMAGIRRSSTHSDPKTRVSRRSPSLRARLEEAEATIRAIEEGVVDAVVVNGANGPQVYTLEGADHPYRVLVEQMPEGTITLDSNGLILYSNRQFAALVGTAEDSITGSDFGRFMAPRDANLFAGLADTAALRGQSAGELDLRGIRGGLIPVRLSLTQIDLSGMKTLCIVATDLREQRRSEAILKDEQLSRLILEQAGEAIVVIDTEGRVMRCSESARKLARAPILSNQLDAAFAFGGPDGPVNAERILSAMRLGQPMRGVEATIRNAAAGTSAVLLSASPLFDPFNALLGCVITLTDITDRKASEEALARQTEELSHANSDLRQFAHSASHDLREPLRQLAVFSELLQQKYHNKLDAEAVQLIAYTVDAAHRMEGLLKGLLDYTQATGSAAAPVERSDPNEVMRKTMATFGTRIAESGARIECELLPLLDVHEIHLTQLFQNLIGNALKYRGEDPPVIHVAGRRRDDMWQISVTDNGIGVPPHYREQIFHLFKRLHGGGKYSGSGIGLAICQKIVQRYGGRIWVESAGKQGARFVFTLPGASL